MEFVTFKFRSVEKNFSSLDECGLDKQGPTVAENFDQGGSQ